MNLSLLASHRAECAARLEAIGSETSSRDAEERAAQNQAYGKALAAYKAAEGALDAPHVRPSVVFLPQIKRTPRPRARF